MPLIQCFYILLLCFVTVLVHTGETENNNPKPIILTHYYQSDNSKKVPEETDILNEEEVEELEFILEQSPKEAQCVVNHLQDPTFFSGNEDYRSVYFVGEPGSGKTSTARAITHEMKKYGWKYKFISSTSLLKEYRNQTAIQLQRELESAIASGQPTIVVVDELHQLLENSGSPHHDSGMTATTLWGFLDRQQNNPNFFFIGTMNRITHLPKPFKSRILFDYIEFQSSQDMQIKKNNLRKHLTTKNSCLNTDVTDEFLNKELEKMGLPSARDLKKLSSMIQRIQKQEDPSANGMITIQKTAIAKAVIEYIQRKEKIQYDREDETDEERHDRYHNENTNLQKKHHAEQIKAQKENQELQKSQFAQQQMIQIALAEYQERLHVVSADSDSAIRAFNKLNGRISDEQKQIYAKTMSNTWAREAAEIEAERAAARERARIKAEEREKNRWIKW